MPKHTGENHINALKLYNRLHLSISIVSDILVGFRYNRDVFIYEKVNSMAISVAPFDSQWGNLLSMHALLKVIHNE